jgi:hypothetical protein
MRILRALILLCALSSAAHAQAPGGAYTTITGYGPPIGSVDPAFTVGSDATGDTYYRNSAGNVARLGIGSTGQFVQVSAGLPAWATTLGYANGGTNATSLAGAQANFEQSEIRVQATGVNFNSVADTAIAFTMPAGYTRLYLALATISNASHTLTTATFGVFTAASGGGVPIIASGTAITVSATTDATNNNMQQTGGGTTESFVAASLATPNTLYFRVTNAEGTAATGDVSLEIRLLP